MPQFERRLYEPSDDLQPFDGDEDMEDEGSRLPLLIGIALIVLLSFAGVVWLAYTQGVQRGRADAPQIAGTQRDTNLASIDQKPTPYSKLRIYQPPKSDEDVASDDPAPPPSAVTAPNISSAAPPSASKTQGGTASSKETEALKSAGTESAAPAPPPADADAPARTATSSTRAITPPPSTSSAKLAKATAEPKAAPVVIKTSARQPPPKPAATAATTKLTEPKPAAVKSPPPKPVTTTPAKAASAEVQKAKASEAKVAALTPQATTPAATTPAVTTPPTATAASDTTAKTGSGSFLLQIGSYKSDSEANASWQTYKGAHGSVAGYSSDVRKVELGAKGTWYRLRIGPFASLAEANAACVKLKAQGGNCFPARQ